MLPIMTGSTPKPIRTLMALVAVVAMVAMVGMLALPIAASPSYAANPEAQASQAPGGPSALTEANATDSPDATCPPDGQCFADVPASNPFYEFVNRIYMQDLVTGYQCGGLGEPCDPESRPYYRPGANVTRQQMSKFIDNARRLREIHIEVTGGTAPIYARNETGGAIAAYSTSGQALVALSQSNLAIYAQTTNSTAVHGMGTGLQSIGVKGTGSFYGVDGTSTNGGAGVNGTSSNVGVYGTGYAGVRGDGSDIGVFGFSGNGEAIYGSSSNGWAGSFTGNVQVSGNLSKGGGSFKIDDPLDPANKYLYHSFVESPDMMNVYNGNVTTGANGEAIVALPAYFEALNRDYRYQLTVVGQFAQAIVSEKVKDNRFTIKTDKPNVEVSWQVTGIRQDPYANAHRIPVVEDKPAHEKGKYLHPTEWGQPESLGVKYEALQKAQRMMQDAGQSMP